MCKLPLSVEVWGYTNEVRLRGLIFIACGGRLCLCSRDFNRLVFLQNWDAPNAKLVALASNLEKLALKKELRLSS